MRGDCGADLGGVVLGPHIMKARPFPAPHFASLVHGPGGVPFDDPAEALHEASRLYPSMAPARLDVAVRLDREPALRAVTERSGRTHAHRDPVELPSPSPLTGSLGDLLARRRSGSDDLLRPLGAAELSAVLAACYASGPDGRRPVPSGGALYPLELYPIAAAVNGVTRGVYHFDPFRTRLNRIAPLNWNAVRDALAAPELLERTAALLVVTAMFSRTRFKYGTRGYRFALLEAGHLVQNALLAATDLGLPALPIGGFFDRRLDAVVGADGLEEASVYAVALGGRA
jgi:SagB-type dehydrogenase family enzyme